MTRPSPTISTLLAHPSFLNTPTGALSCPCWSLALCLVWQSEKLVGNPPMVTTADDKNQAKLDVNDQAQQDNAPVGVSSMAEWLALHSIQRNDCLVMLGATKAFELPLL
jgi:hypothetical protein